jgi:hypothetical protein
VKASAFAVFRSEALYRDGCGCTLLAGEPEVVLRQQRFHYSDLPPASEHSSALPWPVGRAVVDPAGMGVDTDRLKRALDAGICRAPAGQPPQDPGRGRGIRRQTDRRALCTGVSGGHAAAGLVHEQEHHQRPGGYSGPPGAADDPGPGPVARMAGCRRCAPGHYPGSAAAHEQRPGVRGNLPPPGRCHGHAIRCPGFRRFCSRQPAGGGSG